MTLFEYAKALVDREGKEFRSGDLFAKVLTTNDDAGRHGVLIPTDAYDFFPRFDIGDPKANHTMPFSAFDAVSGTRKPLSYKYYERYPERRITRLPSKINAVEGGPRMVLVIRASDASGAWSYYSDVVASTEDARFRELFEMAFGAAVPAVPGAFITRPIEGGAFVIDADLGELIARFDAVRHMGWVNSRREGDTGVGYTFEDLIGVKENNDRRADFRGIEIKCKGASDRGRAQSKMNLFQQGPVWDMGTTARERIRAIGTRGSDGLYKCHSQVSPRPNNLGLSLDVRDPARSVFLKRRGTDIGHWAWSTLEKRLVEKHSRLVVVKAECRKTTSGTRFHYDELVYCERPDIDRFLALVQQAGIVFEFLMSEKAGGEVRNHGYPWRLTREELLDSLFRLRVLLRSPGR